MKEVKFLADNGNVFCTLHSARDAFDIWSQARWDMEIEGRKYKVGDFRGREALELYFGATYRIKRSRQKLHA
jgi:hypothetical protein